MGQSIQETARLERDLELGHGLEPDIAPRVCEEIETILAEAGAVTHSAAGYEDARRRVLDILGTGDRCRREDLTILDELERRALFARLAARH